MIKKLSLFFTFLCLSTVAHVIPDPGEYLYPHIRKVDNDLYFGKMKGHENLYLAMERVTEKNVQLWKHYASLQADSRVTSYLQRKLEGFGQGSRHFELVLNKIPYELSELWVAYVTSHKDPQHIPESILSYSLQNLQNRDFPFAKDIKMFVTVTSSSDALLTSHIGINASAEAVFGERVKGISMPLHSFGAQVMLRRNLHRRFMMNVPTFSMQVILMKALTPYPHSIFIGTREMQEKMEQRLKVSFDEFVRQYPDFQKEMPWLRSKESTDEDLKREFEQFQNPYMGSPLADEKETKHQKSKEFLKLMETYPPLLSVDREKHIEKSFTIYDQHHRNQVWLHIEKENPHYQWLFTDPASVGGPDLNYVLVSLKALADAVLVINP